MNAFRLSLTDLTGDVERKGDDDFPLLDEVAELVRFRGIALPAFF